MKLDRSAANRSLPQSYDKTKGRTNLLPEEFCALTHGSMPFAKGSVLLGHIDLSLKKFDSTARIRSVIKVSGPGDQQMNQR